MDRKEVIGSNSTLSLGQEIFDRTDGMCVIGSGPGGIGVTNPQGTKISLMLLFKPDPSRMPEPWQMEEPRLR